MPQNHPRLNDASAYKAVTEHFLTAIPYDIAKYLHDPLYNLIAVMETPDMGDADAPLIAEVQQLLKTRFYPHMHIYLENAREAADSCNHILDTLTDIKILIGQHGPSASTNLIHNNILAPGIMYVEILRSIIRNWSHLDEEEAILHFTNRAKAGLREVYKYAINDVQTDEGKAFYHFTHRTEGRMTGLQGMLLDLSTEDIMEDIMNELEGLALDIKRAEGQGINNLANTMTLKLAMEFVARIVEEAALRAYTKEEVSLDKSIALYARVHNLCELLDETLRPENTLADTFTADPATAAAGHISPPSPPME